MCPVCNMKMGGSTLGPAAMVFKDGKVIGFETAGHMFQALFAPDKYGFDAANIKSIYVSDYGSKKFIDAKQAFFVPGSDVKGHMGQEIVSFSTKENAETFKAEHKGKNVAAYGQVTPDDVQPKKKMLKMKHEGH